MKGYWVGVWAGSIAVFLNINLFFEGAHPVFGWILAVAIVFVAGLTFDALKEEV